MESIILAKGCWELNSGLVDYVMHTPPVFVEGLVVKYGSFVAVDNVSFLNWLRVQKARWKKYS